MINVTTFHIDAKPLLHQPRLWKIGSAVVELMTGPTEWAVHTWLQSGPARLMFPWPCNAPEAKRVFALRYVHWLVIWLHRVTSASSRPV